MKNRAARPLTIKVRTPRKRVIRRQEKNQLANRTLHGLKPSPVMDEEE